VLIVDAQVHIWSQGTPSGQHRQTSRYSAEDCLKEMAEGGVDAAALHPPGWDPNDVEVAVEAARQYPDRFGILGHFPLDKRESRSLIDGWKSRPGMLGLRFFFLRPHQQNWLTDGTMDWLWPAAERAHGREMTPAIPILSIRRLSKSFGALVAAQGIDLDLIPGARVALIGPNGAGKTTFVNLLTGFLMPDSGTIALAGENVTALRPEERVKRGLARTHQISTLLVDNTARDNVAIAIAEREGFAWRLLRFGKEWRRCCDEAQQRLDEIEIGVVAERCVSQLPYGEKRLLEIAIALALSPRVLLLDEPAAGVPSHETEIIHQAMGRLPPDIAILIIEHDMDVVFRFAHEIVVLVQGRVLTRGTPEAVSADPRVRTVYLGKTAR
jgi:branched-chain amino acid transport system ATP-binding protein